MEVLTSLMRKAKEIGELWGFKVNVNEEVDMLQFADDTIIISEGDTANLWSMKAILRGFELMSGLGINFHKSNLYGINVGDCVDISFVLRRRCSKRFRQFKATFCGMGEISKERSIGCVGTPFVNLERKVINLWWERKTPYGGEMFYFFDNYELLLDKHFAGAVDCCVGNGEDIQLWYACWVDQQPITEAFPELFQADDNHLLSVAEAEFYEVEGWKWDLQRMLAADNTVPTFLMQDLFSLLQLRCPQAGSLDAFVWRQNSTGEFSVKACYDLFKANLSGPPKSGFG
ncbi:uncharacterized protein LOC131632297 [Vicia villosa]|uniref:uncharacterized protein LOC131632297 n=1 Tax=Vicia villosa TaxID=3911 RepID=UPI00273C9D78|nr:uncharacterized protein LOC131632297 [Vicia villosa]